VGDVVDSFVLEEAIGVGGMGAVFRALDTKLDRQVALKLLPLDQAGDSEIVPRFYQEGRSAAQLDHENIARVYSIGHDGPYHYIAFEYIAGVTVRQRVETSGTLPIALAVDITLQIAHALVHARARGVVHRDIKPSNIIITPAGRAKLVDMGLARNFERGGDNGLTQSGMTLGSFDYISPEQARDPRDVDVRSDLYSLGCTLFHMLTGRPPFPGGTVIQKLIQHQEEAPADVRTLNPAVPTELAGIIAKLLAKDRDRRYQAPEHLVRDLLGVAGSLGLATTVNYLPGWLEAGHRPAWERHLVWLVPAVGFVLVVLCIAWWGREPSATLGQSPRTTGQPAALGAPELNVVAGLAASGSSPISAAGEANAEPANPVPAYLRNIPVSSNEDLLEILATAPRRAVIVLSDDGPYRLGGRTWSSRSPAQLANSDLTIKAEPGVRPLLKFAADSPMAERPRHSLFHFTGGRVTIEGLEFELDSVSPDELVAAVRTEDTELLLRGCSFRRTVSREGKNVAAIHVRTVRPGAASGDRPPAVFADTCHFDGGQAAILAEGPADVVLRDCTLGPGQPSVWFDNARSNSPVFGELRLLHTSVVAGSEPVLRFDGTQVRVWVDDSVVAPAGRALATLVMVDDPRNLTYRGRSNLYSGIGVYLGLSAEDDRSEPIVDFAHWKETPAELRETGTTVTTAPVWDAPDPAQALLAETDNPTRAFLLTSIITSRSEIGARQGPFGSVLKNARFGKRTRPDDLISPDQFELAPLSAARQSTEPAESKQLNVAATGPMPVNPAPAADSEKLPSPDDPMNLPTMPLATAATAEQSTTAAPSTGAGTGARAAADQASRAEPPAAARDSGDPAHSTPDRRSALEDEDVIRGAEQFLTVFKRLGRQGGTLRIAAGADLDLPAILIDGSGRYQLVAEPGPKRPRLRFRAAQDLQRAPADWTVMLNLRSGSLHVQGIDLVVPDQEMAGADKLAVAGLLPGTELTMTDCTLTLAANRPGAALFVVQPVFAARNSQPADLAAGASAVIRLRDSLLRSGGEGVTVPTGRKVDVQLTNVLVSAEGSLVHAFGGARPGRADSPSVKLRLDQVTALVKGGLLHLDSTPDDPELSFAAIVAESSILSTANRDEPLFRLDGRDQRDDLSNKIRWEGRKVAYDRIQTYRRDEVLQTGLSPQIYNRANWTNAFLPTDESPILGDVKFLRDADAAQASWKIDRDDFRLAAGSPIVDAGPDLKTIPRPPAESDL